MPLRNNNPLHRYLIGLRLVVRTEKLAITKSKKSKNEQNIVSADSCDRYVLSMMYKRWKRMDNDKIKAIRTSSTFSSDLPSWYTPRQRWMHSLKPTEPTSIMPRRKAMDTTNPLEQTCAKKNFSKNFKYTKSSFHTNSSLCRRASYPEKRTSLQIRDCPRKSSTYDHFESGSSTVV